MKEKVLKGPFEPIVLKITQVDLTFSLLLNIRC